MKYSLCITNYNSVKTVKDAIDSILSQVEQEFEVIVVDNSSDDGSFEILREYARTGRIRLFTQKEHNRGLGRQNALLYSTGNWVISGLDMDDVYLPRLHNLLSFYHAACEGKILSVKRTGIAIAPKELILKTGGWRDLQRYEQWELFRRMANSNSFLWTIFLITGKMNEHSERRKGIGKMKHSYECYLNSLRVKHKFSDASQSSRKMDKVAFVLAKISSYFYPSYSDGKIDFTSYEHEYFVDSSDWWPERSDVNDARIQEWYEWYKLPLPHFSPS